jgi:hypothetical protein
VLTQQDHVQARQHLGTFHSLVYLWLNCDVFHTAMQSRQVYGVLILCTQECHAVDVAVSTFLNIPGASRRRKAQPGSAKHGQASERDSTASEVSGRSPHAWEEDANGNGRLLSKKLPRRCASDLRSASCL